MLRAVLVVPVKCICMTSLVRQSLEGQRRDEFSCVIRHDHLHIRPGLYEKARQIGALVCGDPSRHPQDHCLSFQHIVKSFLSCYTFRVIVLYPDSGNDNKEELNNERKKT